MNIGRKFMRRRDKSCKNSSGPQATERPSNLTTPKPILTQFWYWCTCCHHLTLDYQSHPKPVYSEVQGYHSQGA